MPSPPTNSRQNVTRRVEKWRRGDPLTATKLNQMAKTLDALTSGTAGPRQVASRGQAQNTIAQFAVQSVASDYLICRQLIDGVESAEDIAVAKPYQLREIDERGSTTYTYTSASERVATLGADTETQVIVPSYLEGDIIYAASNIVGGTSVTRTVDNVDVAVGWLDLNVDGRAWAKKAQ